MATAVDTYAALAADIQEQLDKIGASLHDRVSPDALNWGHVGTLERTQAELAHLIKFLGA